jgi:hypothetical protein
MQAIKNTLEILAGKSEGIGALKRLCRRGEFYMLVEVKEM